MLHSKATLDAAVTAILAGEREPVSDLEKYATIRALDSGAKVRVEVDVDEAIRSALWEALLCQVADRLPAGVRNNPALRDAAMARAAEQIKSIPKAQGIRYQDAPRRPKPDPAASAAERERFERDVLLEPQHAKTPQGDDARRARLEAKVAAHDYGRMGKLLDFYSAPDRERLQVVDRSRGLGCFGKLGILVHELVNGRPAAHTSFRPLTPSAANPQFFHMPHAQAVGQRLAYLPTTKSGDPAPEALANGLGTWEWQELAGAAAGVYVFVPAAAESEAA